MSKTETDGRVGRDKTKTLRVSIKDWLFLDEMAGQGTPLSEALHELIENYKEYGDMEEVDWEEL